MKIQIIARVQVERDGIQRAIGAVAIFDADLKWIPLSAEDAGRPIRLNGRPLAIDDITFSDDNGFTHQFCRPLE